MVKIALLGATGGVGGAFLNLALERGHEVYALARTPSKLAARPKLIVEQGDATDPEALKKLTAKTELLVCCVGNQLGDKVLIMEKTGQAVVAAAPKRALVVSSLGINGTSPTVHLLLSMIAGKAAIANAEAFDKLIREASFPSVVVRPTALKDAAGAGKYLATTAGGMSMAELAKADVALFLADVISDTTYDGQGVQLHAAASGGSWFCCSTMR